MHYCLDCVASSTAIVTTDQMSDWHAMMVSLMWNVQAWRDWLQHNINRAIAFTDVSRGKLNVLF